MATHGLSESIIAMLADRRLGASEIYEQCLPLHRALRMQDVEHELSVLTRTGVVIRQRDSYYMAAAWVVDVIGKEFYMPQPSTPTAFDAPSAALPESMQRTWSIHSLTVLERFLRQAVLSLFAASTSKQMYAWLPHVWLPLCGRRRELLFQHRLRRTGSRIECIVGSNYQLDQMLSEEWPDDVYRVRLGTQNSFSEQRQFHFHLIDDYVLLAQSDTETAARIDTLFQKYPYPEDIPPAAVRELVQAKASITLTLLKDSGEARALRRRFETLLRKTA